MDSSSKKILFVVPRYHTNMVEWINSLLNHNFSVEILSYTSSIIENYGKITPKFLKPSLFTTTFSYMINLVTKIFSLGNSKIYNLRIIFFLSSPFQLNKLIKSFKPDLIILREKTLTTFLLFVLNKFLYKKNIYLYTQSFLDVPYKNSIPDLLFPAIKISPIFKYSSFIQSKFFLPFVYRSPLEQIIRFFDYEYCFLIVSKFEIRKRLFEFMKLFHESNLPSIMPSFIINIVGEVTTIEHKNLFKKISDYIKENNINYIKLHANVANSEIINFYFSSNVFILSSFNEVASYSNIEAMANGLIAIVGDLNGTSCYIDHKYDGFIYKTNDLSSLISTIELIIRLPIEKFQEIRENAFLKFKNLYNQELFIDKISSLLEK